MEIYSKNRYTWSAWLQSVCTVTLASCSKQLTQLLLGSDKLGPADVKYTSSRRFAFSIEYLERKVPQNRKDRRPGAEVTTSSVALGQSTTVRLLKWGPEAEICMRRKSLQRRMSRHRSTGQAATTLRSAASDRVTEWRVRISRRVEAELAAERWIPRSERRVSGKLSMGKWKLTELAFLRRLTLLLRRVREAEAATGSAGRTWRWKSSTEHAAA